MKIGAVLRRKWVLKCRASGWWSKRLARCVAFEFKNVKEVHGIRENKLKTSIKVIERHHTKGICFG